MAANKIDKLLMVSDFNENRYLGVFWSEELVGNDEICIQGHFYEATIFKMAANKISIFIEIREQWNFADFVGGHFENKNDPECNFHHYQSIPHLKITLDINFHWNRSVL
jgi:hypothetical protein